MRDLSNKRALAMVTVLAGVLAGCGQKQSVEKSADAQPTLAQELNALSPEEQLATLRALDRQRPNDATVQFHVGNAYYSMGSALPEEETSVAYAYYDSAVAAYTRAVEIDSMYSKAYVNMGLAYDAWGKRPEARRSLRTAVEVNPNDVLAHCHLGQLEQSYGDYGEAVRLYRRALELDPNSAQAHYNLGLAFAETKVFREAMVEWEKVIALDPNGELGKSAAENVTIIRGYLEASQ